MSSSFSLKYKILEKIGEGSFSEVLKCQNRLNEQLFAAKRLKKCYRNRQEVYECPEIVAMRKITRHPNIIHIIETHYEQLLGRVTLIFELLDMSIYDYMKIRKRLSRPISESRVKNFVYQLLKGLFHLHKNGLFHRDIKPENILIKLTNDDPLDKNKGEIVKLGDLGSIRGIYSKPPYTEYISTRWYRSPECLLTTGYYGPKMDVWAIGCVFYEILTLRPLFPGNDELDQIHKINLLLGSPSSRVLNKFRIHKSRMFEFSFPTLPGTEFPNINQFLSIDGRDTLKQMLVYDPDHRSNVRRLLEHKYFEDLRLKDASWKRHAVSLSRVVSERGDNATEIHPLKHSPAKKRQIPPAQSEIIKSLTHDPLKTLRSKSGSINLIRPPTKLQKEYVKPEKPKGESLPKFNVSDSSKHSYSNTNKIWNVNPQIATKIILLKSTQKSPPVQPVRRSKRHSTEQVHSCEADSYFQLLNKMKQPSKKTSDPGTTQNDSNPYRTSFMSKSFMLPKSTKAAAHVKMKQPTLAEQQLLLRQSLELGALTSRVSKATETKKSLQVRPPGRKITKLKVSSSRTTNK